MEEERLAAHKKNAARLGAHLVFVDESGFLLIPPVRKTWAPRAQTPVLRHHQRHERISVISGVSVSCKRRRLGLYYRLHRKNIQQAEVCVFVRQLLRHLRGPVIVIWDNGRIHKGKQIRALCRRVRRLRLENFPVYAPQLNPDEGVWASVKHTLANGRPDELGELSRDVVRAMRTLARSQPALRACIYQSGACNISSVNSKRPVPPRLLFLGSAGCGKLVGRLPVARRFLSVACRARGAGLTKEGESFSLHLCREQRKETS